MSEMNQTQQVPPGYSYYLVLLPGLLPESEPLSVFKCEPFEGIRILHWAPCSAATTHQQIEVTKT